MRLIIIAMLLTALIRDCNAKDMTVAGDGTGDFRTVQEAFDAVPENNSKPLKIVVKEGIYKEKLVLPENRTHVVLMGENAETTVITYNDFAGRIVDGDTLNTHNSCSFRILADNFIAMNITFENSAGRVGQAVALEVNSDKVSFYNCRFIGNQDTYYTNSYGRIYMNNCYIEGTTDFIFGKSVVVFDSCLIRSKKNSYITAASTPEGFEYGYVFRNCRLTADSTATRVHLGRPWRDYAKVVFLTCEMDAHIRAEGWHNWSKDWREETVFYAEYRCTGPGADRSGRVGWSHELSDEEAELYTLDRIFGRQKTSLCFKDNWLPGMNLNKHLTK